MSNHLRESGKYTKSILPTYITATGKAKQHVENEIG